MSVDGITEWSVFEVCGVVIAFRCFTFLLKCHHSRHGDCDWCNRTVSGCQEVVDGCYRIDNWRLMDDG